MSAGTAALSRRDLLAFRAARDTEAHWIRVNRPAMACRFEVVLPGESARHLPAAQAALDEVARLESLLTIFRDTSEVARVNREAAGGAVPVGPELFDLLRLSRALHVATGGAFDVTATPLSRCWGFLRRQGRIPDAAEREAARALVGMRHVLLDRRRRTVSFTRPGVELNFGSIGKGYALDRAAAALRQPGVGPALFSAGGSSVLALGGGSGWRVDVRSPLAPARPLAALRLRDAALATSGAGEQWFEAGGRRYGHVIDPRSGWPADTGVLSVSVVADDAATADALSTAFLVGGPSLAREHCRRHRRTAALMALSDDPSRPLLFGRHPGLALEAA